MINELKWYWYFVYSAGLIIGFMFGWLLRGYV